jgi:hypothetical protein
MGQPAVPTDPAEPLLFWQEALTPSKDLEFRPTPRELTHRSTTKAWALLAVILFAAGSVVSRAMQADELAESLNKLVLGSVVTNVWFWWTFSRRRAIWWTFSRLNKPVFSSESSPPTVDSWVAIFPQWIQRDIFRHQWHRRFDEIDNYEILESSDRRGHPRCLKLYSPDGIVETLEIADDVDLDELRGLLDAGLAGDLSAAA